MSLKHSEIVKRKESCYTAEILYSNYKYAANKVYLTYMLLVLTEVQRNNKLFEFASADPAKLLNDLRHLIRSIASKILMSTAKINIFTDNISTHIDLNLYLGYAFETALVKLDTSP